MLVAAGLQTSLRALVTGGEGKAQRASALVPEPNIYADHGVHASLSQGEAERHLQAYGGTEAIDHVMNAVRKITTSAGNADIVYEKLDTGAVLLPRRDPTNAPDAAVAPQELVDLLEQPNPWQDWQEFLALLIIDYLLVGNAYVMKFKPDGDGNKPMALYRMAPPYVTVLPGTQRLIDAYGYKVPGAERGVRFQPSDVIHLRQPNPNSANAVFGMGVVAGAPKVFDIELGLVETMRAFFLRGAKLAGIVTGDKNVPDALHIKIQRQFRAMYGRADRAYQVAVLERGLKFQTVQPTAVEAAFVEISKMEGDRIYAMLGVPKKVLGLDDGGTLKLPEARRMFAEETMQPLLGYIARRLSSELTKPWGVRVKYDYGYTMPEEDRISLAADFSTLPGVTVGEVRDKTGLARLGPDKKDPNTGEPIDDIVLNLPGPSTEGPGGHPDQPLGDEAGRPPLPGNTKRFPSGPAVNGEPPSAADVRRREANGGDGKAQLDIPPEVLATADPASLVNFVAGARKAQENALAESEAPPEVKHSADNGTDAFAEQLIALLEADDAKAMKKSERMRLVGRVEGLPGWSKYRGIRERVINALTEGVRRGYSVNQILDGNAGENYEGLRTLVTRLTEEVKPHGA